MAEVIIRAAGDDITEHVIFDDAEFVSAAKGRAGTARLRIRDLEHVYSFATGDSLTLDIDGIRKWGGYIGKIERGYFFEADCTCKVPITPRYLLIDGVDYNVLLQKRVLYDKSTPTNSNLTRFPAGTLDQTALLYYLANHTDLLADGVTTDLIESVDTPFVDDPISGSPGWSVDNFLRYLTSETGAIYYIDPDKALVLTDVDTPNAPYGISDDPDSTEIGCRDLEIDFDGSGLRNDALAWGVGQGNPNPVFARVEDAASIADHGRWQVGNFNPTVWHQATVNRIADSYVYGSPQNRRGGKDDRTSVACTIFDPTFRVAQKVQLRSDAFGFEDVIPIRSETITFDTPTDPRYRLVLAHDIDDPWTTFEFWFPDFVFPEFDLPGFPGLGLRGQLPSNDSCSPQGCLESFSRSVSSGLGTSEIAGAQYEAVTFPYVSGWSCSGSSAIARTMGDGEVHYDAISVLSFIELNPVMPFTYRILLKSLNGVTGSFYFELLPPQTTVGSDNTRPRLKVDCNATGIATITVQVFNQQQTVHATQSVSTGGTGDEWIWIEGTVDRLSVAGALRVQAAWWNRDDDPPTSYQISATSSLGTEPVAFTGWRLGAQSSVAVGSTFLALDQIKVFEGISCAYADPWEPTGGVIWDDDLTSLWTAHYDYFQLVYAEPGSFTPSFDGGLIVEGTTVPVGNNEYVAGPDVEATINRLNEGANYWEVKGDLLFYDLGNWAALNLVFSGEIEQQEPGSFTHDTGIVWSRHAYMRMVLNPTYPTIASSLSMTANVAAQGGPLGPQIVGQTVGFHYAEDLTYHFRVRVLPNQAMGKLWSEDEDEPGWMVGLFGNLAPLLPQFIIEPGGQTLGWEQARPITVLVNNLQIGVEYTNPCEGDHAPDAPCSGRYMCEVIDPITLGLSYQATYQWVPGTDEVWADGLRIDHRDYTPNPALRTIILNEPLVNASAQIYMCYFATCNGA